MARILDGSHWNGRPSISQLRQAKPDIVMWKATQGPSYVDTSFSTMAGRIRKVCRLGAYHFGEPGHSTVRQQVEFFLDHAKLRNGEIAMLDLEQSWAGQHDTMLFQHDFGDLLHRLHPGARWLYAGGFASNGSGRDAADHWDQWMYPRYRTMSRITSWPAWPPYAYPAGGGTTGWKIPDVWQFSPAMKWAAGLYGDASISPHSVAQLTGAHPAPAPVSEEDVAGYVSLGITKPIPYKKDHPFHVKFDHEFSDTGKQHGGPGAYPGILCRAAEAPLWSADVSLAGLKGTWQFVKADAKQNYKEVGGYRQETDASKVINGTLSGSQHLYLKVNPSADGTLTEASVRLLYWRHA